MRRWTAWKLAVSAFVLFHMTATLVWVVPDSAVKATMFPWFRSYMIPLALWQAWGMFAPEPVQTSYTLEAEVSDAKGISRIYEFPKVADLPWWEKMPKFRYPKLAANLAVDEFKPLREVAARHAVRSLSVEPKSFPVTVQLYYQVVKPPPFGTSQVDRMTPPTIETMAAFQFDSWDEVHRR
ncbi:hypothetical protein [Paludisphaera rhizosphaerae]|uniref:hypothetical protein n=1 Tax=Paludisphaera rhizosphaerae TaxID=2711216 RepID=UPI0013ED3398|nr:hypothetical protein [Paludisphaera rhizosphaerae]